MKWIKKLLGIDKIELSILNIEKDVSIIEDRLDYAIGILIHLQNPEPNLIPVSSIDFSSIFKELNCIKNQIKSIPKEITIKNVLSI